MQRLSVLPLAALALACATQPAHRQKWIELTTPHFEIVSSLSTQHTLVLAADIEGFRSAVEFMIDAEGPAEPIRTRVFAYDGRGFVRPFGVRGESSFFLPSLRGGVIVLRTGSGWRGDATQQLRHEYAHYLFRQREGLARPVWIDEGFGLLASTAKALNGGADIGTPRADFVRLLQNRIWMSFGRVIRTRDLASIPKRHRDLFDAQSWILVHHLLLGKRSVARDRARLHRYFDRLDSGLTLEAAFQSSFGLSTGGLKKTLTAQIAANQYGSVKVRTTRPWDQDAPELRPLTQAQVASRLGWLSVVMGRPGQAREYFEMAIAEDPGLARAQLGIGAVDKLEARWEAAKPHYAKAVELAADDPIVQLEIGGYYHARATRTSDAATRSELAKLARAHYEQSITLDGSVPEAYAMLGATYLLPGEDAHSALEPLLRAQDLLPSSLEIQLLIANQQAAVGLTVEGRRLALGVFNRTHSNDLASAARGLLDRIEQLHKAKDAQRASQNATP